MTNDAPRRRLRWWWIAGGAVALLGLVAVALAFTAFRDTTTPLEAEEVVEAFTSTTRSAGTPVTIATGTAGGEPGGYGVYVYETSGFEEIDALGGARHDYPAQSFMTLQAGGCGTKVRWDVLEERWSEWEVCDLDGVPALAAVDSFHRWYGVADLGEWVCNSPGPLQPPAPDVTAWTYECGTGASVETYRAELIGTETLVVGGEEVDTVHVRVVTSTEGRTNGSGKTDSWFLPGSPLVVRRIAAGDSVTPSAIGDVSYSERYELQLASLQPVG